MVKRQFFCLLVSFLFSFMLHSQCIIKPGKGLDHIYFNVSTIDDVMDQYGHSKVEMIWHKEGAFGLPGRYEYLVYYKDWGLSFSTYSKQNYTPDIIIKTITLDSGNTCKTLNGIGIGNLHQEIQI